MQVYLTKCDGPGCVNEIDHNEVMNPTFHKLSIGGSDFEMSFDHQGQAFDFCSIDCLRKFLNKFYGENNANI